MVVTGNCLNAKNEKVVMVSGRQMQLIKQVGEYIVAAELCRRELIAASFSGNIPIFDILAIDTHEKMRTIQVKTTTTNRGWNLKASDFLNISKERHVQKIAGVKILQNTETIFCFVNLKSFGINDPNIERDEFYIIPGKDLQAIVYQKYAAYLEKKGGVRPKNPDSEHIKIKPVEISMFKEKWDCFL